MDVLVDSSNDRLLKVKALRSAGIEPYPATAFKRTHSIPEVMEIKGKLPRVRRA